MPPAIQYSLAVVLLHDGSHYRAISVDAKNPHGNHVIYDGMGGPSKRTQIFNSNDLTAQYAQGYNILELWYVKLESSSDAPGNAPSAITPAVQARVPLPSASSASTILPTPSTVSSTAVKPPGIPNLGNTCYLTTLVQIIFWVAPLTNGLIDVKLTKNDSAKFDQAIFFADDSKTPKRLFEGLKCLKLLLSSMKKSIEDKKTHLSQTRTALKSKMTRLCNSLKLSQTENQCVNEFWTILFDHYFDILGVSHLYKVEIIACYREIVDPNSRAKPREKKEPKMQTYLQIHEADLKK